MDTPRPYHLLFVCTANICRSPMAEGLAQAAADRRGMQMICRSGGVMGLRDKPAADNAIRAMAEVGVDIHGHLSRGVYSEDVDWADYILVMESRHARKLRSRYAHSADKTLELASFGGMTEIRDPVNGWMFRFRRCRSDLQRCIDTFVDQLPPIRHR
ncbi:MAG: hypothetical protein AAFV53_41595 [Myxococcota bacterium]